MSFNIQDLYMKYGIKTAPQPQEIAQSNQNFPH